MAGTEPIADLPPRIDILLMGNVPSKKNSYTPRKGGKGFFKGKELVAQLEALMWQIPLYCRDLKLVHPHITMQFTVPNGLSDRDNKVTTVLDLLKSAGVIWNDSIASCNGRMAVLPAIVKPDEAESAWIRLRPPQGGWQRKKGKP